LFFSFVLGRNKTITDTYIIVLKTRKYGCGRKQHLFYPRFNNNSCTHKTCDYNSSNILTKIIIMCISLNNASDDEKMYCFSYQSLAKLHGSK